MLEGRYKLRRQLKSFNCTVRELLTKGMAASTNPATSAPDILSRQAHRVHIPPVYQLRHAAERKA
jgi:hypothetical protein